MKSKFWQKLLGTILAILMVVPFSFIHAKAITTNANYSLTQYNYYVDKQGTNWATTDIFVNFKAPASGTITININPTLSSTYYSFVVISGGNLAASPTTSTSKLTIGVRSQQNIQIRVQSISTQSNAHATYTMSFSGTYEDGEALSLDNIDASLVTLNGKIDTTNNVLSQINTKLANFSIQDYTQILNTINTSIGSVQTAIEDLPDYTNVLNNINTYLGSIDTNVSDIESICSGIQTTINNILSTLQNIDNLIDKISWQSFTSSSYGFNTDGSSSVSTEDITTNQRDIYFNFLVPIDLDSYIYKIQTGIFTNAYTANYNFVKSIEIKTLNGNSRTLNNYYIDNSGRYLTIYIYDYLGTSNNTRYIQIHANNGGSSTEFLRAYGTRIEFYKLPSNDIEYWKLLSYFQEYNYYYGNSASQEAISDQHSTNQTFESQSNQYHSVESTFQSNFDTAFDAINPSDTTTALNQYASAFSWFTNQLGALYDSSGNFKILFTLPLLLGIAMFFLGRGAAVFMPAERVTQTTTLDSYEKMPIDKESGYTRHVTTRRSNTKMGELKRLWKHRGGR